MWFLYIALICTATAIIIILARHFVPNYMSSAAMSACLSRGLMAMVLIAGMQNAITVYTEAPFDAGFLAGYYVCLGVYFPAIYKLISERFKRKDDDSEITTNGPS